jgi:hypothetical protein
MVKVISGATFLLAIIGLTILILVRNKPKGGGPPATP